jgi:phosphoribosylglycinamide formyltransferase-1
MASGRGSNFDALLKATRSERTSAEIVVVLSDQRGAAVLEKARGAGVPVEILDPGTPRGPWSPEGIEALRVALQRHRVEAVCLAGFMRIVPPEILREFPSRILNIHPSLLPSFPGLRAQRKALRAGVKVSGCTVHLVDEGVDTGPIVIQAAVPVEPDDTEDSLAARILEQEHRIYPQALFALAENRLRVEGRVVSVLSPEKRS